jgi:hypothetical protein
MACEHHDLQGSVEIHLKNRVGRVLQTRKCHNLIVNSGRELVAKLVTNQAGFSAIRVQLGSSGDPELPDQVSLITPLEGAIKDIENLLIELIEEAPNNFRAKMSFSANFGENEGVGQIREAGIVFEEVSPGNTDVLYNRVTFDTINKTTDDELTLNWEIRF